METENLYVKSLKECIDQEYKYANYDYCIKGVPVYGTIRRYIRGLYCRGNGVGETSEQTKNKKKLLINTLLSFFQILKLFIKNKKCDYLVYSFYRTDKINDVYIDKFTDPLIDNSKINDNYIIFEHSKGGEHKHPRIHAERVIYTDFIDVLVVLIARCFLAGFKKKHFNEFAYVWKMLDSILGEIQYSRDFVVLLFVRFWIKTKIYEKVFKKIKIKCLIAPARPVFLELIFSAKKMGIKVLEVQHGVLSSVGISYSGKIDEAFTPDYFLSYGVLQYPDFYGIPIDRIVNVGWALPVYFKDIGSITCYSEKDVLVVLNPLTSKYVIEIIMDLAKTNPDVVFYLRPHPTEAISIETVNQLKRFDNIKLQDNLVNFSFTLFLFKLVVGDNSTAINEAFSEGKKVGRLSYPGLVPLYVNEEEKDKTWRIYDDESFKSFINAEPYVEIKTKVYSEYNRKVLDELLVK